MKKLYSPFVTDSCDLNGTSKVTPSLRFIRRLTPCNVSFRPWVRCAVELISGLGLITSFRLFFISHPKHLSRRTEMEVNMVKGKIVIDCLVDLTWRSEHGCSVTSSTLVLESISLNSCCGQVLTNSR